MSRQLPSRKKAGARSSNVILGAWRCRADLSSLLAWDASGSFDRREARGKRPVGWRQLPDRTGGNVLKPSLPHDPCPAWICGNLASRALFDLRAQPLFEALHLARVAKHRDGLPRAGGCHSKPFRSKQHHRSTNRLMHSVGARGGGLWSQHTG
jgi:hypothetical protein